jgi:hypothetical protein
VGKKNSILNIQILPTLIPDLSTVNYSVPMQMIEGQSSDNNCFKDHVIIGQGGMVMYNDSCTSRNNSCTGRNNSSTAASNGKSGAAGPQLKRRRSEDHLTINTSCPQMVIIFKYYKAFIHGWANVGTWKFLHKCSAGETKFTHKNQIGFF